jgi:hypothetical protein
MNGKTIRIYLVDGVPTGILTAEIINWTGKILVAPRSQLADLARRPEVKRTGIYFLVGPDPENPLRDRVYVGEGDNVLTRLTAHDKDESKDFWTRCAIVISKDENLTKAHGRYLESRLIALIRLADRAALHNTNCPDPILLPEPDVADMEFILVQLQQMLPVLGMSFLQPQATIRPSILPAEEEARFYMKEGENKAFAIEADGEFVVIAGSPARKHGHSNWVSYRSQRDALVKEGKLVDGDGPDYYRFAENVSFASPSAAAAVIAAGNRNGRTYWKHVETNQTYAEWHDAKLASLNANAIEDA